MTPTLRPGSLGEILDRTFEIYRSNFLVFLGIAALPFTGKMALILLGFIVDAVVGQTTLSHLAKQGIDGEIAWFAARFAGAYFYFLMWPIFATLVSQITLRNILNIRSAFLECFARWRGWMLLGGIFWLIESEIPRQLRNSSLLFHAWLTSPFWLTTILTTIEEFALIATLCLSIPAWSIEKVSISEAISRSWTLSKRQYRRMFMAWILQAGIAWSIGALVGGLLFLAFRVILGNQWSYFSGPYATFIISVPAYVSSIIAAPVFPIALALIYYDQRIRLEGFDIEWMMEAAGMNAPVPAQTQEAELAGAPSETRG